MRVAIAGTGGIGFGTAAMLRQAGHAVRIWSPSGTGARALLDGAPLRAEGAIEGAFDVEPVLEIADALEKADVLIITVPGTGHRSVMDRAAPHLRPGQVVIVSSHASFSGVYLSKLLAQRGLSLPIVAWASTAVMARRTGPDAVYVAAVRGRFDVAAIPPAHAAEGFAVCAKLIGDGFRRHDNLLPIAVSNINPHAHMAMALGNLTRIEAGETWSNYQGLTPAVGRLVEALDAERVGLAKEFGIEVRTIHQHMQLSFDVPLGPIGEMAAAIHAKGVRPQGPNTLENRYVLEDVPFGLVPTVAIGRIAGVRMPLHQAGIDILSAIYGTDFRAANDLLPALAIETLDRAALARLAREGWPRA